MNTITKFYAFIALAFLSAISIQNVSANNVVEDVVYTPPVAVDKAIHPINSAKRPLRTVGDILPIQTFDNYRSDYNYPDYDF